MTGRLDGRLTQLLGGRDALSLWSWLLTLPFAATIMTTGWSASAHSAPLAEQIRVALIPAVATHALLALFLWLLKPVILTPETARARAAAFTVVCVLAGAARPWLLDGVTSILGGTPDGRPSVMLTRMLINAIVTVAALGLIAVLVGTVRHHSRLTARLRDTLAEVDRSHATATTRLADTRRALVDDVLARVEQAVSQSRATRLPGRHETAALLRSVSEGIVRSASHGLVASSTEGGGEAKASPTADTHGSARPRAQLRQLAGHVRPATPGLSALVFAALVLPHLASSTSVVFALVQLPIGCALYALADRVMIRLWLGRFTATTPVALKWTFLATGYLLSAAVVMAQTTASLAVTGRPTVVYWSELVLYPVVAVSISAIQSALRRQSATERKLATAIERRSRETAAALDDLRSAQLAAGTLLHSSVQGALVATAWSLAHQDDPADRPPDAAEQDSARQAAEAVDTVLALLRAENHGSAEGAALPDRPGAELGSVFESWAAALTITIEINGGPALGLDRAFDSGSPIWAALDVPPATVRLAIDVLSEGFTNAIRHGHGSEVLVRIDRPSPTRLELAVRSENTPFEPRPRGGATAGIGLTLLRDRVNTLELSSRTGHTVLAVTIDVATALS